MFTKAFKLSITDKSSIEYFYKNVKKNNKVEVQLLDLNDPLDNLRNLKDVVSVHAPLFPEQKKLCNISNIGKGLKENGEYATYLNKVAHYLRVFDAGLVVHADISPSELEDSDYFEDLLKFIEQNQIELHIENVNDEVKDQTKALSYPLGLCSLINKKLGKSSCHPLLDICHFQMCRNAFDSNLKLNLQQAIDLYKSDKYFMHFNNIDGSGDSETGGKHSFNFSNDLKTLNQVLEYIKPINPTLIIETNEDDLNKKERAVWLINHIEEFEKRAD